MKKKLIALLALIIGIVMLGVGGCSISKYRSLTDFQQFKGIDTKSITAIGVSWSDTGGPVFTKFTMDDEDDVKFIVDKVSDKKAFIKQKGFYEGNNDSFTFFAGDKELGTIGYTNISDNNGFSRYSFTNSEVYDYIKSYMIENDLETSPLVDTRNYSIKELAPYTNFDRIVKIEVGWQTAEIYEEGAMVFFDITDKEAINYIIEELSGENVFEGVAKKHEKKNYTNIRFLDDERYYWLSSVINISEDGNPRLTNDEVRNYIHDYGVTNGYLQM